MTTWLVTSRKPGDGDSIWIAVLEHDGINTHVEYAQTWLDYEGLLIHRYEGERSGYGEAWPPDDVLFWMPCEIPAFIAACPFCGTAISELNFKTCCTGMIAARALGRRVAKEKQNARWKSSSRYGSVQGPNVPGTLEDQCWPKATVDRYRLLSPDDPARIPLADPNGSDQFEWPNDLRTEKTSVEAR